MKTFMTFAILTLLVYETTSDQASSYIIDNSVGYGRTFNGIGAISGGGATSKLLVNYPEQQRSEILDYLFKPNFGASLHIFKVEIGGDIQSTDGTEASHMHYGWDEDYTRGYEWWMLQEAKKRNPNIKLYGLPWGFPGWLRDAEDTPWKNIPTTADYIVKWINGAKVHYNLTIDYIGIWNESPYNVTYIKTLRKALDMGGFSNTLIIAPDQNGWPIVEDITKDKELFDAVYAIGSHYPEMNSPPSAVQTGKPLWASEDRTSHDDVTGGGCLSRTLNQNYVTGLMTSTIFWNVVTSYYYGLPDYNAGLMSAGVPWTGHYEVRPPIWMTAHTTQFTEIGWKYFKHGYGVGNFTNGGSYVVLTSPDEQQLTIIIETLSQDPSECTRPARFQYLKNLKEQIVNFQLKGKFAGSIESLNAWYSRPGYSKVPPVYFKKMDPVMVQNGSISLTIKQNEVWTLTTVTTGNKGSYPNIPDSGPFPIPYAEDFEGYSVGEEPYYFAQQIGSFEVGESDGNKFMKQMVIDEPVHWYWCHVDNGNTSLNVFGDYQWQDVSAAVAVQLQGQNTSDAVFLAVRATSGGCVALNETGLFMFFYPKEQRFVLTVDLLQHNVLMSGKVNKVTNNWDVLTLQVKGSRLTGAVNTEELFDIKTPVEISNGWVAVGTYPYGIAWFDDFQVSQL
ncbi:hypothetical protein SNE40_012007 [Patella caerulea]|uniref:galactosylceramidase n=1 Tax=Patella caerulea TaxID=87958 RepID=A0AAN8JRC7_PATCE